MNEAAESRFMANDTRYSPSIPHKLSRYAHKHLLHYGIFCYDRNRVVLPGADEGPTLILIGPYDKLTDALVQQFPTVASTSQLARPGGIPYRRYVVNTRPPGSRAIL